MAKTTKKGNAPETRTVKVTYTGYTCVCTVKDWGDSESVDIEVTVGKQSLFTVYRQRKRLSGTETLFPLTSPPK